MAQNADLTVNFGRFHLKRRTLIMKRFLFAALMLGQLAAAEVVSEEDIAYLNCYIKKCRLVKV